MDIQEIFSLEFGVSGKLPSTHKWTSNNDAEALLYIAGSARANNSAGWFGFNVKVDGKQVANPSAFSNDIGNSRPLELEALRRIEAEMKKRREAAAKAQAAELGFIFL